MEEKCINLLLSKCVDFSSGILFIHYNKEIKDFIDRLCDKATDEGIKEIYRDEFDPYYNHDVLLNSTLDEIKGNAYFNSSIWDEYASKNASFLIFETEYPHLLDDVEPAKIGLSAKLRRTSRPIYRKMVEDCTLSWCIAAYPSQSWADDIFNTNDNYNELLNFIYKVCMIDKDNPVESWDNHLIKINNVIDKLNSLNIEKLYYRNNLGTNLTIYLPENYLFSSAKDSKVIVNMPSYEVFASPIYNKTEGVVYSSMPLNYNGGLIDKFYLKFKEGKVVEYDAEVGREIFKEVIESDANSCYLGECALVEKTSPIAKMKIPVGTTLIDENASCHLALGAGFRECIKDGNKYTEEELLELGINSSKNHVDFMIGTDDLNITATTRDGREVPIFINGKYSLYLLK